MSAASQHTLTWRQKKHDEGYEPMHLWLPMDVCVLLKMIALQDRKSESEVITEALERRLAREGNSGLR